MAERSILEDLIKKYPEDKARKLVTKMVSLKDASNGGSKYKEAVNMLVNRMAETETKTKALKAGNVDLNDEIQKVPGRKEEINTKASGRSGTEKIDNSATRIKEGSPDIDRSKTTVEGRKLDKKQYKKTIKGTKTPIHKASTGTENIDKWMAKIEAGKSANKVGSSRTKEVVKKVDVMDSLIKKKLDVSNIIPKRSPEELLKAADKVRARQASSVLDDTVAMKRLNRPGATVAAETLKKAGKSELGDNIKKKILAKLAGLGKKGLKMLPIVGPLAAAVMSGDASAAVPGLEYIDSIGGTEAQDPLGYAIEHPSGDPKADAIKIKKLMKLKALRDMKKPR